MGGYWRIHTFFAYFYKMSDMAVAEDKRRQMGNEIGNISNDGKMRKTSLCIPRQRSPNKSWATEAKAANGDAVSKEEGHILGGKPGNGRAVGISDTNDLRSLKACHTLGDGGFDLTPN